MSMALQYAYVNTFGNEITRPPWDMDPSWLMDAISKVDRNQDFLSRMMAEGEASARSMQR